MNICKPIIIKGGLPQFVDVETLREFGINASTTYKSQGKPEDLPNKEKCSQYFQRSYEWIYNMLKNTTGYFNKYYTYFNFCTCISLSKVVSYICLKKTQHTQKKLI